MNRIQTLPRGGEDSTAMPQEQLDNWFSTPDQLSRYVAIRAAALAFAQVVNQQAPDCANKSAAIRMIREAAMSANVAITYGASDRRGGCGDVAGNVGVCGGDSTGSEKLLDRAWGLGRRQSEATGQEPHVSLSAQYTCNGTGAQSFTLKQQ
jgi:hypothetical protein